LAPVIQAKLLFLDLSNPLLIQIRVAIGGEEEEEEDEEEEEEDEEVGEVVEEEALVLNTLTLLLNTLTLLLNTLTLLAILHIKGKQSPQLGGALSARNRLFTEYDLAYGMTLNGTAKCLNTRKKLRP